MPDVRIKIYTTPTCPWCKKAKEYFKQRGLSYTEIDVSKDQRAAEEMVRKSGQMGVPVIEIGSQIIVGFDKAKIERILGTN
ncbi:MAG TPA: glutaredoxin family protein [Fervidobacterium sp.]|nr:glutaredoxin family protein [Fervidobacterium sp.]HPT54868.1 glutaredoxin family protein [Fervidobacterium sp.]HQE49858.1 glutaredoxin family protein [Fervidobacterium sp.]HUM44039.1 glutaredoxin family protein [Fervidobacterium sp.]